MTQVIDVKAGGGKEITIGEMLKLFLTKMEWFDTRFPRIPINVQKEISDYFEQRRNYTGGGSYENETEPTDYKDDTRSRERSAGDNRRSHERDHRRDRSDHRRGGSKDRYVIS